MVKGLVGVDERDGKGGGKGVREDCGCWLHMRTHASLLTASTPAPTHMCMCMCRQHVHVHVQVPPVEEEAVPPLGSDAA